MELEKAKMMSLDMTQENIKKIRELFPNAVTETTDEQGNVKLAVDFDVLKQELSDSLISDKQERYQMTWPDKKQAILLSYSSTTSTLRPLIEKSVSFSKTKNLYIEGDNLEVLKSLREAYLNKVKLIYIDPPYNTGNDFLYNDNFSQSKDTYLEKSGQLDESKKMMFNSESDGRFHTNWLNMIYPRLKCAKDLLKEDGIIFISIDDSELFNLKKICDEIFGSFNFICNFIRKASVGEKTAKPNINRHHDYVLCYAKDMTVIQSDDVINGETKTFDNYDNPDNDPNGPWTKDALLIKIDNGRYGFARYPITNPYLNITHYPPVVHDENNRKQWHYVKETFDKMVESGQVVFYKNKNEYQGEYSFFIKKYKKDVSKTTQNVSTLFACDNDYTNAKGTIDIQKVFGSKEFANSYPKPVSLIRKIISYCTKPLNEEIILDFFSGSGTTAQAVIEQNIEDGGNRKFVLVQLPEKNEAGQSRFETICDIGEERIRKFINKQKGNLFSNNIDLGFRVFKLDSSNMNEVYYNPKAMTQDLLEATVDNIKPDRSPLDLLFQVMLECGALLSSKIEEKTINGKKVFVVEDNYITACFDDELDDKTVEEIAKLHPVYACFKGSSFSSDSANINAEQIFKTFSPNTEKVKVI